MKEITRARIAALEQEIAELRAKVATLETLLAARPSGAVVISPPYYPTWIYQPPVIATPRVTWSEPTNTFTVTGRPVATLSQQLAEEIRHAI